MSLLRRRMLLAASKKGGESDFGELPPESTEFTFPLYLNITELAYEDAGYREYERAQDEISTSLYTWFFDNAAIFGNNTRYWRIDLDETNQIYINGVPVTRLQRYEINKTIDFYVSGGVFDFVQLDEETLCLLGVIDTNL